MNLRRVVQAVGAGVAWLPRGHALEHASWLRRHRGLTLLLWAHVPGLLLYGALRGYSGMHALLHLLPLFAFAAIGGWKVVPRRVQALAVTFGLLTAAALGVHVSDGLTESHFLFFVLVIGLALYEDWLIFLLAIAYVVVHHGVAPAVGLGDVYSHAGDGWIWAVVHGGFVLLAAALCVVSWRAGELARAELRISERLKLESQLRETQKLESLGLMAAGVAHDFNNLLLAVLGNAALVLDDLPAQSPLRAHVEQIDLAGRRAAELTRQMLAYSGTGRLAVEPVELGRLVEELASLVTAGVSNQTRIVLELAAAGRTVVHGDQGQLSQVVLNLLTNAAESLPGGLGVVVVRTCVENVGTETFVCLEVADTGCGMDAATRQRMFEPFFTTKFTGRGLGLAAVAGIVRSHGGRIDVRSAAGEGTTCRVLLPTFAAAPPTAAVQPMLAAPAAEPETGGAILLVDDEPAILEVARRLLERSGFDVVAAAGGSEAVQLQATRRTAFAAAVIDMNMPGLNGLETMRALRAAAPALPVLLTSGYTPDVLPVDLPAATGFVQKPYSSDELVRLLRAVIRGEPSADVAA